MRPRATEPPRAALMLVRLRERGVRRQDLEADLRELFDARVSEHGVRAARRRYWIDALSLWTNRWSARPSSYPAGPQPILATRRGALLAGFGQDLVFAARLLRRHPAIVALTVVGLSLAIGIATAVFSILNAAALRPLGVDEPAQAVAAWRTYRNGASTTWPYAEYVGVREFARLTTLEAFIRETAPVSLTAGEDASPPVPVDLVSGGFFSTFGGRAVHGRPLLADDDRYGQPMVAVVNHTYWKRHLGADPAVVGRSVEFFGRPARVVGVAEPAFSGPTVEAPAFWVPFRPAESVWSHVGPFADGSGAPVSVAGRMSPGVPSAQAQAELSTLVADVSASAPVAGLKPATGVSLVPADNRDFTNAQSRLIVTVIMTALCLILLLAAANVAHLLLAIASTRRREIAVRLSVGATPGRLVRQLLTESLALATAGGVLGLLAVVWLLPMLGSLVEVPATLDIAPDRRVYTFAALVALLSGTAAGLAPTRYATRGDMLTPLASDSAQTGERPGMRWMRSSFIGSQAAASMMLLIVAALLTRAAIHVMHLDLGFDARQLVRVSPSFGYGNYDEGRSAIYWDVALERIRTLPGVERTALVERPPFGDSVQTITIARANRPAVVLQNRTSAGYFETAGIRLLAGRAYTGGEVERRVPVAVISRSLARELWGTADPVGTTLDRLSPSLSGVQIVGVAADALTGRLANANPLVIYRPLESNLRFASLLVRGSGDAATLVPPLRDAVGAIDPGLTVEVRPVHEGLTSQLNRARALAALSAIVGGLALALALIGLFGMTAFSTRQRLREIGVRMAIGASNRDVTRLLIRDTLRPVMLGGFLGVGLALGATRVLEAVLYGISTYDRYAYLAAVLLLAGAATLAVYFPARRAGRTDPVAILRQP